MKNDEQKLMQTDEHLEMVGQDESNHHAEDDLEPLGTQAESDDTQDIGIDELDGKTTPQEIASECATDQCRDDRLMEIRSALDRLIDQTSTLNRLIESRLSYDAAKEKAFNRLYSELDECKRDMVFSRLRPFYIDLLLLYDRMNHVKSRIGSRTKSKKMVELLETLSEELIEVLYRQKIEMIETNSSRFDPALQRTIGISPTAREDEDLQIDRVVRRGFRYGERILRAEEVVVKKYRPTAVLKSKDGKCKKKADSARENDD